MTCSSCGGSDAGAVRGDAVLCAACAERIDWMEIIELVQSGPRLEHDVEFTEPVHAETVSPDPFA